MHAAVVALRGAGVPRALTAALVQQVRYDRDARCVLFVVTGAVLYPAVV
jgi:hypothetical protein